MNVPIMRVFISGPYTLGDVAQNVRRAIDVAEQVMQAGHTPFVPHLSHFWHLIYPHDHGVWLDQDLRWLKICDCMIRLPGESRGADEEEAVAAYCGIPVYYSVSGWLESLPAWRDRCQDEQ